MTVSRSAPLKTERWSCDGDCENERTACASLPSLSRLRNRTPGSGCSPQISRFLSGRITTDGRVSIGRRLGREINCFLNVGLALIFSLFHGFLRRVFPSQADCRSPRRRRPSLYLYWLRAL